MSLDPRTVAVQGLNVTPLLVAVQGLLPLVAAGTRPTQGGPLFIANVGRMMGR